MDISSIKPGSIVKSTVSNDIMDTKPRFFEIKAVAHDDNYNKDRMYGQELPDVEEYLNNKCNEKNGHDFEVVA